MPGAIDVARAAGNHLNPGLAMPEPLLCSIDIDVRAENSIPL